MAGTRTVQSRRFYYGLALLIIGILELYIQVDELIYSNFNTTQLVVKIVLLVLSLLLIYIGGKNVNQTLEDG